MSLYSPDGSLLTYGSNSDVTLTNISIHEKYREERED